MSSVGHMPNAVKPRGPYAKSAQRREEILASALTLFADGGFESASLTAIADAVGVSREALRHYFSSREELLLAVIEARDARSVAMGASAADGTPLMTRVAESGETQRAERGLASLYASMVATSVHSSDSTKAFFAQRFEGLRTDIEDAIRTDQARGLLRSDVEASALAALIVGAFEGLQQQWLIDERISVAEGMRLLDSLLKPHSGELDH